MLSAAFDTVGCFGYAVEDAVTLFNAICPGHAQFVLQRGSELWPLDVVVLDDAILTNADEEIVAIVDNVAERFTNVGCRVRREVSPVPFVELIGQHRIVEEYEIARMHQSLMNESGDSIGEKLREAILRGHQISDDIYRQARRFLINSQDRFWGRFQKVDALLFPAMPQTAPEGFKQPAIQVS